MQIEVIDTLEAFAAIKPDWELVYQADPQALFSISWDWLADQIQQQHPPHWSILGAKRIDPNRGYMAFFLMVTGLGEEASDQRYAKFSVVDVIEDLVYAAMVALPGHEEQTAAAFANYLKRYKSWSTLKIEYLPDTNRHLRLFANCFSQQTDSADNLLNASHTDCADVDGDGGEHPPSLLPLDRLESEVTLANVQYHRGQLSTDEYHHYALLNKELGDRQRQVNKLDDAIAYYRQAITLAPKLATAHYALGKSLENQVEHSQGEIITCYQTAWRLQPNYREAEVALANILYQQGKLSNIEKIQYAVANYDLGHKYRQIRNVNCAITYYRQAIAMKPDLSGAHYHLGLMLQIKGAAHWPEAISCYQQAHTLNPSDPAADIRIATIRYQQGELSDAEQLRYGLQLYNLGHRQQQSSDLDGAIDSYRLAIEMAPSLTAAQNALRTALQARENVTRRINRWQQ